MIGTPYGVFQPEFVRSLAFLLVYDAHNGAHVVNGGAYLQYGTTNIPHGRNQIVKQFLERLECDWLLFVDTDQSFDPDLVERMLASADAVERPILGALVFSYQKNDAQEIVPTIWHLTDDDPPRMGRIMRVPDEQLVTCAATGTGCVLIHRKVFEAVRDFTPPGESKSFGETSWPWFRYTEWVSDVGPDVMGEDLTFFLRATAAGFPTTIDTTIEVGHIKRGNIGRREYELQAVEAPAPRFVVIPVKGQHHYTHALLDQLVGQGQAQRIFVFDNGSDSDPFTTDLDVDVIPAAGMNIHEMWNAGVDMATQSAGPRCDVAILNNDLWIGPDFLAGLSDVLRHHPRVLAVCPNYDARPVGDGFEQLHGICAGRYDGTGGLAGFAFMVRGEPFAAKALRFDENFGFWCGDNDFVIQLEQHGAVYGMATRTDCKHLDGGGRSTVQDEEFRRITKADGEYLRAKWNVQESR